MITRPLDLAARLRPPPRNFDAFFFVNAGLLALFFMMFGSRFVLAPGLGVDFQLPAVVGANAGARPPTHVISVINSGQILTNDGLCKMEDLNAWLNREAKGTVKPLLLVRASAGVPISVTTEIVSAARRAGFEALLAAEEPPAAVNRAAR